MNHSIFVTLGNDDDIRRSPHSLLTIYVGGSLTIDGTRAAYEKIRDVVTEILADLGEKS